MHRHLTPRHTPASAPRRVPHRLACAAVLAITAGAASAQSIDRLDQRGWVQLSGLHAHMDSSVRVDFVGDPALGLPAAGTLLDFEEHLGLPRTTTVPSVVFGLRLFDRWRVEFESYRISRKGDRQLFDEEIVIDGVTYAASAEIATQFESRVDRLTAGYSLLKSPDAEAGVSLGVQYTRYRLGFVGVGRVNGEPPETRSLEERDSGPLPTVGVFGNFALGSRWSLAARADYLPVDSRKIDGYLGAVEAQLYYKLADNWSLGVGYRVVEYKVKRNATGELGGLFQYRLRGPQLVLEAGF